ncbi:DUF4394 domain-containing protein [Nisaea sp.]|uniref:DUF4394 domain-containing protein n=1 Tax=Nisaea sp. TaxID=2024842 RepID=UPI002B278A2E|nr:DUF4394 domain-containing protein [Nisaea sp.]
MTFSRILATAALVTSLTWAAPAFALDLIGLTANNQLLLMTDTQPGSARSLDITGVDTKVLGIDIRPADLGLYAVTASGTIYTIDTKTGAATRKSKISERLEAVDNLVVDFNPQADRLRVMASNGQNLRVNVETGAAVIDGRLAYDKGDTHAGEEPGVLAGAYINSYKGTKYTQLFDVDSKNGMYVVQDPPNDGVLKTVGPTGLAKGTKIEAIDIFTDPKDEYHGFAAVGGALYTFSVAKGAMSRVGKIASPAGADVIDIATPVVNR